jgi:predicted nucleotidyltransferase component of viral defense system
MVDIETINRIKKLTITSLVQDDELMESLVLKGGNAISLGYGIGNRASYDLDFSLEEDFDDLKEIEKRLENAMIVGFSSHGLVVFDFKILEKPKTQNPDLQKFWGGYALEFKVIGQEKHDQFAGDLELIRRNAMALNPDKSTKFKVDISKFEYVGDHKKLMHIDGIYFYIYAPELIVFEKVRALAQKLPEYYTDILQQDKLRNEDDRARARDFFDIYEIMECYPVDLSRPEARETLLHVFEAKRVPPEYLRRIRTMEEVHRQGYQSVVDTISNQEKDRGFDFYFDYFLKNFEHLLD